jgi:hypothetical protein
MVKFPMFLILLHVVICRYEEVRGRVMRCRHPNDVAKLDKQLAAEWEWLQDVRRSTAAAANQCNKQVGGFTCPVWIG